MGRKLELEKDRNYGSLEVERARTSGQPQRRREETWSNCSFFFCFLRVTGLKIPSPGRENLTLLAQLTRAPETTRPAAGTVGDSHITTVPDGGVGVPK